MLNRGSTARTQLRTTLVLLAGVLVVGVVIGTIAGRAARSAVSEPIKKEDYIVLVAHVYERERSVFNAQERLASQGIKNPAKSVADLAATYRAEKPSASQEIASLEELAQALARVSSEAPAAASASPGTEGAASQSSSGSLLVLGLIFIIAVAVAAAVAARLIGFDLMPTVRQALAGLNALPANGAGGARGRGAVPGRSPGLERADLGSFGARRPAAAQSSESIDHLDDELDDLNGHDVDDDLDVLVAPPDPPRVKPVSSAGSKASFARPAPSQDHARTSEPPRSSPPAHGSSRTPSPHHGLVGASVERKPRPRGQYVFRFAYEHGDEDFEVLHPVRERGTDRLLGTCCLGAALRSDTDGGVYAFTAWVQDYTSQELRSVGLITSWAMSEQRDAIDRWVDEAVIDETLIVDRNASVEMQTQNLSVTVTVTDYELLPDAPSSPLLRLNTRFEVMYRKVAVSLNGH